MKILAAQILLVFTGMILVRSGMYHIGWVQGYREANMRRMERESSEAFLEFVNEHRLRIPEKVD